MPSGYINEVRLAVQVQPSNTQHAAMYAQALQPIEGMLLHLELMERGRHIWHA
jgi:hypothetical protein